MSLGNWAMGFFILTILLKGAIGILVGDVKYVGLTAEKTMDASNAMTATSASR
jgi:molybdopterin-containing oxidoreductase family membrane subunit